MSSKYSGEESTQSLAVQSFGVDSKPVRSLWADGSGMTGEGSTVTEVEGRGGMFFVVLELCRCFRSLCRWP